MTVPEENQSLSLADEFEQRLHLGDKKCTAATSSLKYSAVADLENTAENSVEAEKVACAVDQNTRNDALISTDSEKERNKKDLLTIVQRLPYDYELFHPLGAAAGIGDTVHFSYKIFNPDGDIVKYSHIDYPYKPVVANMWESPPVMWGFCPALLSLKDGETGKFRFEGLAMKKTDSTLDDNFVYDYCEVLITLLAIVCKPHEDAEQILAGVTRMRERALDHLVGGRPHEAFFNISSCVSVIQDELDSQFTEKDKNMEKRKIKSKSEVSVEAQSEQESPIGTCNAVRLNIKRRESCSDADDSDAATDCSSVASDDDAKGSEVLAMLRMQLHLDASNCLAAMSQFEEALAELEAFFNDAKIVLCAPENTSDALEQPLELVKTGIELGCSVCETLTTNPTPNELLAANVFTRLALSWCLEHHLSFADDGFMDSVVRRLKEISIELPECHDESGNQSGGSSSVADAISEQGSPECPLITLSAAPGVTLPGLRGIFTAGGKSKNVTERLSKAPKKSSCPIPSESIGLSSNEALEPTTSELGSEEAGVVDESEKMEDEIRTDDQVEQYVRLHLDFTLLCYNFQNTFLPRVSYKLSKFWSWLLSQSSVCEVARNLGATYKYQIAKTAIVLLAEGSYIKLARGREYLFLSKIDSSGRSEIELLSYLVQKILVECDEIEDESETEDEEEDEDGGKCKEDFGSEIEKRKEQAKKILDNGSKFVGLSEIDRLRVDDICVCFETVKGYLRLSKTTIVSLLKMVAFKTKDSSTCQLRQSKIMAPPLLEDLPCSLGDSKNEDVAESAEDIFKIDDAEVLEACERALPLNRFYKHLTAQFCPTNAFTVPSVVNWFYNCISVLKGICLRVESGEVKVRSFLCMRLLKLYELGILELYNAGQNQMRLWVSPSGFDKLPQVDEETAPPMRDFNAKSENFATFQTSLSNTDNAQKQTLGENYLKNLADKSAKIVSSQCPEFHLLSRKKQKSILYKESLQFASSQEGEGVEANGESHQLL